MEITIRVVEQCIGLCVKHEELLPFFKDYITNAAPDLTVAVTPEDIAFERRKTAKENALEGLPVQEYPDSYLEITAVQRKVAEKLFDYDTLVFHGSVVAVDGAAYLFTAKSGTGKSTHTRLWREVLGESAVMVNDDKPFLRMSEEGVTAYGSPWNGKHRLGANIAVPLKAICILERGEENEIHQIEPREALMMLFQQSNRPVDPGKMPKYMELLDKLAANVKYYRMKCNMDPEAARRSYAVMSGQERKEKL